MSYPSFEEYTDALRLPSSAVFEDPLLAGGLVRKNPAGVPFARSGNFALTYEVAVNGSRYAVRCFHKESDSLERRYAAIARKLKGIASRWFVDFDFQPTGIRTESGQFPIVRMQWADGCSLAQFISEHRDEPQTLLALRDTLRDLARHLQAHDIAHGDIQPGNIIVRSATDLKLVDYDGMFVPELEPWGSTELGQRNFQHPGRSWLHYDERLDRFSFTLLDVALEALAMQPALWELTGSDEASIVLRAADFLDPSASAAFGVLAELDGLGARARQLAALCRSPFERVPALDDFLAGRRIPNAAVSFTASGARPAYVPAYAVLSATNFARCCAHIGDRVELIGMIRRVVLDGASGPGREPTRVEFGDVREDMVQLSIWPEAAPDNLAALEPGQWLSAIGLVDPIRTEANSPRPYKSVSIVISERSQLRLLTQADALHRLAANEGQGRADQDVSITIGTDPAIPGPWPRTPPPAPASVDVDGTHATPTVLLPQLASAPASGEAVTQPAVAADPAEIAVAPVVTTPIVPVPILEAPGPRPLVLREDAAESAHPGARETVMQPPPPLKVPATNPAVAVPLEQRPITTSPASRAEPEPGRLPVPESAPRLAPEPLLRTGPEPLLHGPEALRRAGPEPLLRAPPLPSPGPGPNRPPGPVAHSTRKDTPATRRNRAIDWRLRWPRLRIPTVRWPALRMPAVHWHALRWPAIRMPAVRWPALRIPAVRWDALRWPEVLRLPPHASLSWERFVTEVAQRWPALRRSLPAIPPLSFGNPIPHIRAALRSVPPIPSDLKARLRGVHPAWWLAAFLMAVVLAQSWIIVRKPDRSGAITEAQTPDTSAATPAPVTDASDQGTRGETGRRSPSSDPVVGSASARPVATGRSPTADAGSSTLRATPMNRLLAYEDLRATRRPIITIAGPIDIVTDSRPPHLSLVTVAGKAIDGSSAEINVLAHRSVYADREVIVGFSGCTSATPACERKQPFWLLLRKSQPPVFKRSPGLRANENAGVVTALASGVHVDLGLWDGVRQTATLTSLDGIYVTRIKERSTPLSPADCRDVGAALESCAASRECGSYETIAGSVPPARMGSVQRLFHESTGLNEPMFRTLCVRSCELGLTPTSSLVRREVCSGSATGQWTQVPRKAT